ncbi:metal-sulfur cluster assembly factor [Candidatus Uhrbacteria bacterium]|nr:metal-sulfur cluster assembly factor [Candidatus Uhrbacteria bacterium]
MLNKDSITEALKHVYDPELGYDIVSLGLVYDVRVLDGGAVEVDATLTSPGCPLADTIVRDVTQKVAGLEGVTNVNVNIVWDPPYSIKMMDPDLRAEVFPMYKEDTIEADAR